MRQKTGPTVLLGFSRGKDAVGAWLQLRRHFEHIIPICRVSVPGGLPLERELLSYYEDFFGAKLEIQTHPTFWQWLHDDLYASPGLTKNIVAPLRNRLAQLGYLCDNDSYADAVRRKYGVEDAWFATGVRAADSARRGFTIRKHGPVTPKKRIFLPVYDWNVERLDQEITEAKVALPVDYELFGCSMDGLDYKWAGPLAEHRPEDWAELVRWFPLLPAVLHRHRQNATAKGYSLQ